MTLDRLTQITSVGITSGITLNNPTLTGVTTIASLDSVSVGGTITAVDGNFSGNVTAVNGTFSGNVSVAGTITYEDVTNIDSVGLITARSGIHVTGVGSSVGIGLTNPNTRLEIAANNNSLAENNTLRFTDTDTSTEGNQQIGKIEFYSSDVSVPGAGVKAYIGAFAADTTPDAHLDFATQDGSGNANPVIRMRIKSDGNVGIGTDNPQYKLEVQQPSTPTIAVRNTTTSSYSRLIAGGYDSTGEFFAFQRLGSTNGGYGGAKAGQIWNYADAPIVMGIGSTERLRVTSNGIINSSNYSFNGIGTAFASDVYLGSFAPGGNAWAVASLGVERLRVDSSGRLLVGVFTQLNNDLLQTNGNLGLTKTTTNNQINFHGTSIEFVNRNATTRAMKFYVGGSGGAPIAELSTAGTWTNASDIKNKENIENISYGIDTVKALIPRQYTVKSNGANAIGFIAQEVQPIVPEVVHESFIEATQETHLGLDYGSLTAVLTKALQEAMERIETLEAEVAALKAAQ